VRSFDAFSHVPKAEVDEASLRWSLLFLPLHSVSCQDYYSMSAASLQIARPAKLDHSIPFQRYPQDTLATVQVAICARRPIYIYVASYFPPVAALARRVLDSFSPTVWKVISHDDPTRSDDDHTREEARWRHMNNV